MESYLYLYLIFAGLVLILMVHLLTVQSSGSCVFSGNRINCLSTFLLAFAVIVLFYFFGSYFIGFRPVDAGFDTPNYVRTFTEIGDIFSAREVGADIYGNTEFLFWPLQSLLKVFVSEPQDWLLLLYSIVFFLSGLAYWYLTKDTMVPAYLFVLVLLTFDLVYFGNAIRQVIAFPIGLVSIYFFIQKKYVLYLLLLLLSIGLHWSSLIFLLIPVFQYVFYPNRLFLMFFYLSLPFFSVIYINVFYRIFLSLGIDLIASKFELYLTCESHLGSIYSLINFWYCIAFAAIVITYSKTFKQYRVLYIAHSLLLTLILAGTSIPDFSERLLPLYIFLTPIILYVFMFNIISLKRSLRNKMVLSTGYIVYFIILGFFVIQNESARITLGY